MSQNSNTPFLLEVQYMKSEGKFRIVLEKTLLSDAVPAFLHDSNVENSITHFNSPGVRSHVLRQIAAMMLRSAERDEVRARVLSRVRSWRKKQISPVNSTDNHGEETQA